MSETEEFRRTLNEGGYLLRMNKPAEALEKLLPLYEIAPANIDVAINLGSAYILLRKRAKTAQATKEANEKVLVAKGFDPTTTEVGSAEGLPFYYAEDYHQQYLHKVPNGYDCHAETAIAFPPL